MNNNMKWRAAVGGALLASAVPLTGLVAPAQAASSSSSTANVHDFVVVELTGRGDYAASDAQMLGRIDQAIDFWQTETGGAATFEKPTSITELASQSSCNDSGDMKKEAAALFPDRTFDATSGHHLILLMPDTCRTGPAVGDTNTGLHSGGILVAPMGADSIDQVSMFAHEIGHNLGLQHARGNACTADAGCTISEYLNRYSTMGITITGAGYAVRPLDSYERSTLGLASAAEVETLALAPDRRLRTFDVTLRGRGTDSGERGLRINDPLDGSVYYLDFHNGVGRESGTYIATIHAKASGDYFNKGVTVEHVEPNSKGHPTSVLQPVWSNGSLTRYALIDQESYTSSSGGIQVDVTGMDLNGLGSDTARLHVTLTNPNVGLGTQSGSIAISDTGAVGSTVTATTAGWEDADLGEVQWLDNGVVVGSGPSYTIPAGSDGHSITARVTGTRESFQDETATSNTLVVGEGLVKDGTVYTVSSEASGQLLTTPGSPTSSGTQLVLQAGAPASAQQQWRVEMNADGTFLLRNVGTRRCLDNAASSTRDGSRTIEWYCHGEVNQHWRLVGSGTGYALVNAGSGRSTAAGSDGAMSQHDPGTVFTFTQVS